MFILHRTNKFYYNNLKNLALEKINHMQKKLNYLKMNYGQGLIFSQNLLHGNVINKEKLADGVLIVDLNHYSPYIQKIQNILHQLILVKFH